MLKQKVALISATLLLLSTLILPGLTLAADDDDLTGTLVLTGTKDVWYHNYSSGDITDVTFVPKNTASTLNHTIGQNITDNTFDKFDLIGVINMKDEVFTLSVAGGNFSNGSAVILRPNLNLATAGDTAHFTGFDGNVLHEGATVPLTNNATDGVYYRAQPNSGYSYVNGDITAQYNSTSDFSVYSNITNSLAMPKTIISSNSGRTIYGIFAVGIGFELEIPGGTPAGTFVGIVTYTVS